MISQSNKYSTLLLVKNTSEDTINKLIGRRSLDGVTKESIIKALTDNGFVNKSNEESVCIYTKKDQNFVKDSFIWFHMDGYENELVWQSQEIQKIYKPVVS